ncbi:hypothetical protein D1007_39454 [Hordeum vulgare]|nr:hypothetical protein D1007_39454 [Hordeum vulgare]
MRDSPPSMGDSLLPPDKSWIRKGVRSTTSRSSVSRMTRSNPRPTSDEPPLTEYEKVRARNMMRNNRIFQSLGIDAIASMIRKTNDVQQGTTNGVQEGSGVISDDPEYNPKEDEVVVHKTVKALNESRTKRPGVKKTASKYRKNLEASAAMPPRRVMAPPPGKTKRILEPDEPDSHKEESYYDSCDGPSGKSAGHGL